ncbi:MAG: endolytic transglycosylase MltG [Ruminococcaceae bacterium]|nr:endolytic transglycosylase MltG [Oscillospiraceae bacterium]
MANYHDYDDLFASYERRSNSSKQHSADQAADKPKSAGYTSSSSYKKNAPSSGHSLDSVKSKASSLVKSAKQKVPKNKTPEKSQKKYYGKSSYEPQSGGRRKKSAADDSSATVKFNYNSTSRAAQTKTPADSPTTKDEYRRKYEKRSAERAHGRGIKTKSAATIEEPKEKTPRQFSKSFKKTFIFLACVTAATLLLTFISISCVNDVLAINRHSDKAVTITIDKEVDTKTVIKMLKDNHLIKNELFCNLFAKFKGYSDNYETGVFYLKKDMGVEGMIMALKATNQSEETISITFPEGFSIMDIANKLEANEVCKAKNFIDTLENYSFDYDFLPKSLKADKRKYQYLEGYLFPATYEFYIGESPSNVIKKMLDAFKEKIYTDEFKTKSEELGLSTDEIITFASIIQREAANSDQMSDVASVLHNRLNDKGTFPRLECDSTGDFLNKDVKAFLKLYPDKGTIDYFALYYNTYNNSFEGLPAGAICNPGIDAVEAVLNVENSPYYYFCHDEAGEIHLATTLSEFEYIKSEYGVNE